MNEHEQYKQAFSVLRCEVTPEQVVQRAEPRKGVFTMKRRFIPILVGAILILLLGTVTAAELKTHWLSNMLKNADAHPELTEKIQNEAASATVDGTTWTVDHLFAEGRVLYWQLTKTRSDGKPVEPMEDREAVELTLLDADGNDLGIFYSVSIRRLDDGSDPSTCTLLYKAELESPELSGDDFTELTLQLAHVRWDAALAQGGTGEPTPLLELETVLEPCPLRQTVLADGIGVNVGRLSVELQGLRLLGEDFETAAQAMDSGCALVLQDGRELPVEFALHYSAGIPDEDQWQTAALPEIIDPQSAAALRVGETLYPLNDK